MQPALKNHLSSIRKEHVGTIDALSIYLVLYLGETGIYEIMIGFNNTK